MEKYLINSCFLIVKTFYAYQSCITVTMRKLRENNVPTIHTIYCVLNDSEETGSVDDMSKPESQHTARLTKRFAVVPETVKNNPSTTIRTTT